MNRKMYTPYTIGNLQIKNRIVKSAMFEYGAENGRISERIVNLYREAAEGGAGLIITGMQAISEKAGVGPVMVHTAYDGYAEDMAEIVEAAHKNDAKLFVQLQHSGPRTDWKSGYDTFAVSELTVSENMTYHEASEAELKEVVRNFGISAAKCKEAGCDGVQIHAAHGFLLNTFLSPYFNKRTDAYGGNIENRARLLFEVYDAVRAAVGPDYPIAVKISFSDRVEQSSTSEEMLWVCEELEKKGMNMIEVSSGVTTGGTPSSCTPFIRKDEREGTFLESALKVVARVKIPVSSVCGYRTPEFIESVLKNSDISAISLGRPLVREPDLPNRWKKDNSRATCLSCNRCFASKGIISCQVW